MVYTVQPSEKRPSSKLRAYILILSHRINRVQPLKEKVCSCSTVEQSLYS